MPHPPAWSIGRGLLAIAAFLALTVDIADGHSWLEESKRIAPNGTLIGPQGFHRAFIPRSSPLIDLNYRKIPLNGEDGRTSWNRLLPTDPMCQERQKIGAYTPEFPKLKAARGDMVALRYQENGHVTKDPTLVKPLNKGTIYIYATTNPKDDERIIEIHNVWNVEGTGGDKRGWLLATRNFDDGRCYEYGNPNAQQRMNKLGIKDAEVTVDGQGHNYWCQSDIQIPDNVQPGKDLTLYWVWDFSTLSKPGHPNGVLKKGDGYDVTSLEIYTVCTDIAVVDDCDPALGEVKGPKCSSSNGSGQSQMAAASPDSESSEKKKNKGGSKSGSGSGSGSSGYHYNAAQNPRLAAVPDQLTVGRFQVKPPASGGSGSAPGTGSGNGNGSGSGSGSSSKIASATTARTTTSPAGQPTAPTNARIKTVTEKIGIQTVTLWSTTTTGTPPHTTTTTIYYGAPAATPATTSAASRQRRRRRIPRGLD